MLELQPDSRVVMITSAGCNALDYLLDNPAEIHAVDMNHRQNALLQLKQALIHRGNFEDLFAVFGQGYTPKFKQLLQELNGSLDSSAAAFWREKARYFYRTKITPSFYYRGTAGWMAWFTRHSFLQSSRLVRDYVKALLKVTTLDEQRTIYAQVKPRLWNGYVSWLVRQPMLMAMLGVPRPQIRLIEQQFPGGLTGFIQDKLEHVLTRVPFWDNYFWRVYLTGSYTRECCPNYLREENLPVLQERCVRLTTHTSKVADFLRENPAPYSHYVLLDHQDWLAAHDHDALEEEWRLILENSRPGTRILMRSASPEIDFIPDFALKRLRQNRELAEALHVQDRVGTYGCTLLADVVG
jgi:S-adenosylmethionine-diacylglycerol 3-amino-3-carboxypropyl transferase